MYRLLMLGIGPHFEMTLTFWRLLGLGWRKFIYVSVHKHSADDEWWHSFSLTLLWLVLWVHWHRPDCD